MDVLHERVIPFLRQRLTQNRKDHSGCNKRCNKKCCQTRRKAKKTCDLEKVVIYMFCDFHSYHSWMRRHPFA